MSCALSGVDCVFQITPLPGAWGLKPGSATLPFFGVQVGIKNHLLLRTCTVEIWQNMWLLVHQYGDINSIYIEYWIFSVDTDNEIPDK